ncbi:unnamed protein product, partial [marine sediment metagenome]
MTAKQPTWPGTDISGVYQIEQTPTQMHRNPPWWQEVPPVRCRACGNLLHMSTGDDFHVHPTNRC